MGRPRAQILKSLLSVERFPEDKRVPKDKLTLESSQQRVTGIAYPLVLSGPLGSSIANKTSYVGTRIVVNKVNFVIVLRKDTD